MTFGPRKIDQIDAPPESGSLDFAVQLEPASLQSSKERRKIVSETLQAIVRPVRYLISGDVQLEIEWLVHERCRYESDTSPDVDNIVKPLLDALCGPNGLLIDDCQVQALECHWIDWTQEQQVSFRLRFMPEEWVSKDSLIFAHIGRNLYLPFNQIGSQKAELLALDMLHEMVTLRDQIETQTRDYSAVRRFMPIQRPFHKSRLRDFDLRELDDLRDALRSAK